MTLFVKIRLCTLLKSKTANLSNMNQKAIFEINPISHALQASVRVPGSKSLTNRALLIASLANGITVLRNALFSDDSNYFAGVLQQLGFDVKLNPSRSEMTVAGQGGLIPARSAELFIGNAGTAARFLTAFLTLGNGNYTLDGDERMRERPIGDLVSALEQLGAKIVRCQSHSGKESTIDRSQIICLPLHISACGLTGGRAEISGNISSQYLSGLLMVAPYAHNQVEIRLATELISKPYVDLTLAVMSDFGVEVTRKGAKGFVIDPAKYQSKTTYSIECDASAASYFFAAPAILGGKVRVENINRHSKQGDIAFLDILQQMGCTVTEGREYVEVAGPVSLRGVDVDMRDISDTAQTLAVIAPFAVTPTHIRGIGFVRTKESNRISDTCTELRRLGVEVKEHPDGLTIQPSEAIRPASIHTYNDHRMAMAFALIGLRAPGVIIENPACVSKTFPDYFRVLEALQ
jgi:3-phosphoshikimate 1-carboxyvinyltransferase